MSEKECSHIPELLAQASVDPTITAMHNHMCENRLIVNELNRIKARIDSMTDHLEKQNARLNDIMGEYWNWRNSLRT